MSFLSNYSAAPGRRGRWRRSRLVRSCGARVNPAHAGLSDVASTTIHAFKVGWKLSCLDLMLAGAP